MKKIALLLSIAVIITAQTGVFANELSSSFQNAEPTTASKIAATAIPIEKPAETPDSEFQENAVSETAEPEITPTPIPTPAPYFIAMKNESVFASIEENGEIVYKAMLTKNGALSKPSIKDGVTYLPFRYIFENVLGYEGLEEMTSFADIENNLKGKQFTYHMGEPFEIAYRETDDSDVVILTTDSHSDKYNFTYDIIGDNGIKQYNTVPAITRDAVSGSTLMAIRYFSSKGLCHVEWDSMTKTVLLSESEAHAKTKSKSLYKNNDNYVTYSDVIEYNGNPVSLSNLINDAAYAVSRIGDYCLFLNKDKKLCYINLKDRNVYIVNIENHKDIQIQQFSIYNGELYGIAVKEDGYTGEIFNAIISYDGNNLIAANYRKITSDSERAREFSARNIGNDVYLYYTDKNSNMSLKMVNISNGKSQFVLLNKGKMENTDSFSIGKHHIAYYNSKDKTFNCAEFDGYNATMPYAYENSNTDLNTIKFILTDYSAITDVFYYIVTSNSDSLDAVKKITFSSDDPKLIINGSKFAHMAVINNKLYAKTNDNSVSLLDEPQSDLLQ